MTSKLETALSNLRNESSRLAPEQGRIARRNARRAVLGALRQVRNAMDVEFPQMRKPVKPGDPEFVIEIFERARYIKRRLYTDRWVTFRKNRFPYSVAGTMAKNLFGPGSDYCRPLPFATAAKYVKRLRESFPEYLWRLREVGTRDNILMADIL